MTDVTQSEYDVAKQNGRIIHTKINLLNFDFQVVSEISGVILEGSTYNIDATSDIRRTCSISLLPKDNSFNIEYGGKIWIDKYVQVFIGIEDVSNNNEIVYSNLGLFLINNPEQVYDATNNTITINGVDLMAKLTGMRNGYLEGITYQIPKDANIRGAMVTLIRDECGFSDYSIDPPNPTRLTPNELSFGLGSTAYNILTQLRDINSNYQTYFDQEGTFWFNPIPSGENEQIMVDDDIWKKILISYKKSTDFESVKNLIEVFGKTQDDGHTPYGIAYDNNPLSPFYVGEQILGTNKFENEIRIVLSGGEYDNIYPLIDYYSYNVVSNPSGNPSEQNWYELKNGVYVLTTDTSIYTPISNPKGNPQSKGWYELRDGVYVLTSDTSVKSGKIYYKVKTYYTRTENDLTLFNSLAQQRADYELYTRCRLQDQIEVTCVPVYWMDVNWLVEITLPNKQGKEEKQLYITKKVDTTLGVNGTQTITMMKYYPFLPTT